MLRRVVGNTRSIRARAVRCHVNPAGGYLFKETNAISADFTCRPQANTL